MSVPALSLRNKLLVFATLLVLLVGALFAAIAVHEGRRSLETMIGIHLSRESGHTAEKLTSLVERERETLESFAAQDWMREIRVLDVDKRIARALHTLRAGSPVRLGYAVLGEGGGLVATSERDWLARPPDWLVGGAEPLSPGASVIGPIQLDEGVTALVLVASIPDPDDSQARLGRLVGLYDWQGVAAIMEEVRRDLVDREIAAEVLVATAGGDLLASDGMARDLAGLAWPAWARAPGDAMSPSHFVVQAGGGWIVGRAALGSALSGWTLHILEPLAHALAPAHRLRERLLLTLCLVLVAVLTLAAITADRVVRPLSELTEAIRAFARGGAPSSPVPIRSRDEVGTLGLAFNRMAEELDRTQRELVEAEKFAFVGELAAGVAHEVRTSLGVLGSSAQILERSLPGSASPDSAELVGLIRSEVDRLGGVVDDLLRLRRPPELRLRPTPLSDPLERAMAFVEPQAREKSVSLELVGAGGAPVVLCDAEGIQQVCVNLLVNAVQAVPEGGHVEARIDGVEEGLGVIRVRDDGPGVALAVRARLFEPFATGRKGGIGLGLTFVKRVVLDHRGRIELEDGTGPGACFRIALPLAGRPS